MTKKTVRKKLTERQTGILLRARTRAGMSQYALADVLGWPRSKVKRLEKGEVKTISLEDLRAWKGATSRSPNVQELAPQGGVLARKKRSSEGGGGARKKRSSHVGNIVNWFELVKKESRRSGKNQRFFRVVLKQQLNPEQLLGRVATLHGVTGIIHGVENDRTQVPIKAGDQVVIMLWGEGIAQ
jgi:transcriptional regulator with XRE-family HTH domain